MTRDQQTALRLKAHYVIMQFLRSQGSTRGEASKSAYAQVSQAPIGLVKKAYEMHKQHETEKAI